MVLNETEQSVHNDTVFYQPYQWSRKSSESEGAIILSTIQSFHKNKLKAMLADMFAVNCMLSLCYSLKVHHLHLQPLKQQQQIQEKNHQLLWHLQGKNQPVMYISPLRIGISTCIISQGDLPKGFCDGAAPSLN